mmetsp:Transcript_5493/g.9684  ORF Transcript_5493/g.9684 Transcript_5493/m.9684 type:complete len:231 (+) Transcript_5493:48-740(+)
MCWSCLFHFIGVGAVVVFVVSVELLLLHGEEFIVTTTDGKEFVVGASFDNTAAVEDNDFVTILNGTETMGDNDGGGIFAHFLQVLHNVPFGFAVETGGGFVTQENGRPFQNGPGNGHPLLFTSRQFQSPLSHNRIIAIGKAHDGIVNVCLFGSQHSILPRSLQIPILNIIPNRFIKENRILRHHSNCLPDRLGRIISNIVSTQCDSSLIWIVESIQDSQQCTLATPRATH